MTVQIHTVKFERNAATGKWRGLCSTCFWCHIGTQAEVQGLASVHDLEWVAEPIDQPAAVQP